MIVRCSSEVAAALSEGRPVVALESTITSALGLPAPHNRGCFDRVNAAIRAEGAVPALTGLLGGQLVAGVEPGEEDRLLNATQKLAERDLYGAMAARLNAGVSTVSATVAIAHLAGIRIFATGGIGGVHRGAPFDVSADLLELGRTPVAVVCSGAKSILDLPLTLEVLETQGVPVIGLGTTTLPSFYSRSSGLPVDVTVQTVADAAKIVAAARRVGAQHGLLLTVPVPAQDEFPAERIEGVILQATAEAAAQGVHGKAATPFLLGRVAELTGGESRRANTSLLINNARVGGQLAVALVAAEQAR